jgi:hypothetical protein
MDGGVFADSDSGALVGAGVGGVSSGLLGSSVGVFATVDGVGIEIVEFGLVTSAFGLLMAVPGPVSSDERVADAGREDSELTAADVVVGG